MKVFPPPATKKYLFFFVAFACVGITTEIFFTAITDFFPMLQAGFVTWKLQGKSYMWMFPIYGLGGLIFPVVVHRLSGLFILFRLGLYALGIFAVEFLMGVLLDYFTGSCPWEYKYGPHFMGYIRLDYFPAWAFFGLCLEKLFLLLERLADGKGL